MAEYNYAWAFHLGIVVLFNVCSLKACIDNEIYDLQR